MLIELILLQITDVQTILCKAHEERNLLSLFSWALDRSRFAVATEPPYKKSNSYSTSPNYISIGL